MPQHEIVREMTPNSLNSPPRQTESIQLCSARPVRPSRCVPRVGHPVFPGEHPLPRAGHSPSMYVPPEVSPMAEGHRRTTTPCPCHDPGKRKLRLRPHRAVVTAVRAFFLGCSAVRTGDQGAPQPVGALPRPPVPAPPATGHSNPPLIHNTHERKHPRTQPHGICKLLHAPTLIDEAEETRKIEEQQGGRQCVPPSQFHHAVLHVAPLSSLLKPQLALPGHKGSRIHGPSPQASGGGQIGI